jgi:hypothetical protein
MTDTLEDTDTKFDTIMSDSSEIKCTVIAGIDCNNQVEYLAVPVCEHSDPCCEKHKSVVDMLINVMDGFSLCTVCSAVNDRVEFRPL